MKSSPKTSPALPSSGASVADCPTLDGLEAFLRQTLSPMEQDRLSVHVSVCGHCQVVVESQLSHLLGSTQDLARAVLAPSSGETVRWPQLAGLSGGTTAFPIGPDGVQVPGGRFEFRRTIGIGGCGTVFEAWDRELQREVAVKVPHPGLFNQDSIRRRFSVEARAASRLSHPNIIPMFEAQISAQAGCYLISELVKGPSLEQWLRSLGKPVSCAVAAELIAELAEGVEVAHRAGVLHRDLKPSNVLLGPGKRGNLNFAPRITDFGLARLMEEVTTTSVDGTILGSLKYMSPEQATGQSDLGPTCDVYALGVILYELLTGSLPISAQGPAALLQAIPLQEVRPVRHLRPDVDIDVEAICLKCLEKRPNDRYSSAWELAADLRRALAGEPVTARRPTRRERAVRWVRRNPAPSAIMTTILLAGAALVILQAAANHRQSVLIDEKDSLNRQFAGVNRELVASNDRLTAAIRVADEMRHKADTSQKFAEQQRSKALDNLYASDFRRAFRAWQERDLLSLQRVLDRLGQPDYASFRGLESNWLNTQLARPHRNLMQFPKAAYALSFSHQGQMLAAAGRDSVVKLISYADAGAIASWTTHQGEINDVVFTPDDRLFWTSGDDGTLCQWEVSTQRELRRVAAHSPAQSHDLLLLPSQNLLISVGTDYHCRLWDAATGDSKGELPFDTVQAVELHPDQEHLVIGLRQGQIVRWNLREKSATPWSLPMSGRLAAMKVVRKGQAVLAVNEGRYLELCELATGKMLAAAKYVDEISSMTYDDRHDAVYAVDQRGTVIEIDLHSLPTKPSDSDPREIPILPLLRLGGGRGFCLMLSPDQLDLLTADDGGTITAWPRATMGANEAILSSAHILTVARFHPSGRSIIGSAGETLIEVSADTLGMVRKCVISPR